MSHPAEILLKSLLTGRVLTFEDFQFQIVDNELLWRHKDSIKIDFSTGVQEEVWGSCPMTITQFLHHAKDMADSDVWVLSAGNVLRELRIVR